MTTASLWRRLGAMLYDGLLILGIFLAVSLPIIALRDGNPIEPGNLLYRGLLFTVLYIFFVGFWYQYGRTLGMQSWGIRIETPGGGRPTIGQCTTRFFVAIVSWIPFGMGYWWQLLDNDNSSWHDHLSGTQLRHYPKKKD